MADAVDDLKAMFVQFGMADLAEWVAQQWIAGRTLEQIQADKYDQPAYQAHFPAMKALREKGHTISEGEYRQIERQYADVLDYAGLRGSVFDTPQTYQRLMESEVSAKVLEERVADAKMVVDATDPNVRQALQDYYGIGANDLLTYALDPKGHGKDHVERLARSATLRGIAQTTALNLSQQYAEQLAMDSAFNNSTEADYRDALAKASVVAQTQRRLASLDNTSFSDEDAADVAIKGDVQKALASKQRAEREVARFSASQGLASSSLRGGSI